MQFQIYDKKEIENELKRRNQCHQMYCISDVMHFVVVAAFLQFET